MTTLLKDFGGFALSVEYTYSPSTPDQTSGPPEDCYEGDPEELEIESITLESAAFGVNLTAIGFMDELGESMNEKIEEWCREDWQEQCEAAKEDAAVTRWENRHEG